MRVRRTREAVVAAHLRVIVQIWIVIALAGILPVTCIIHCGLNDMQTGDAHQLYVCDLGHGMVDTPSHTDLHATTRIPAFFELLSPSIAVWIGMWLSTVFFNQPLYLRGCVVTPLVPPPQHTQRSTFACG
jgi:hypothetical protein